ncbi:sigma-70 family RNA polymerase sigma factor [Flavivirga eckloniae]|uniref:RNA polymerase sigma-70 factor n=1 Tax=Flavivirga eckloniae TaxID=1803846 RepID=A0A2K9PLW0_9FLAO|nr:sigma-70 family RNA polymerase sigma factor [Flavivirga eckloniae]AUP78042.1 RNA polymerase sigma-70 factor [Flavivirga eckloniae]
MDQNKTYKLTLKEFEKVFKRLYEPFCLLAYKYIKDLDQAKDIVQEVFVKVWEKKVPFENEDKIEGYIYKMVINKAIDFLRSKDVKYFETHSLEKLKTLQKENYFPWEDVITVSSDLIESALKSLPNKQEEVMRLSIEDYKNKEIAEKMSIAVNTVKGYKKEAYKTLRKTFSYIRDI